MTRIVQTALLLGLATFAFGIGKLSDPKSLTPPQGQGGDSEVTDIRVQQALDALDLNYEIEEDGQYKIGVQFEDYRTQIAWIDSDTTTLGSMEIREILSPAYLIDGIIPPDITNHLLQDNAQKKLGAWQVYQDHEQAIVVFTVQIDANGSADELETSLYAVLDSADQMEQELTSDDRF